MNKIASLLCLSFLLAAPLTHALSIQTKLIKADLEGDRLTVLWVLVDTDKDNSEEGYILYVRDTFYDREEGQTDQEFLAAVETKEKAHRKDEKDKILAKTDVKASLQLEDD